MVLDGSYRIRRVVGSGGFGITYEAEDIKLQALVAIKEYYPLEFGDRSSAMTVRPKSERHKPTFDWGLASFQEEARTLARFEHPSIVRVSRVFEANSTAYMVMRFERGKSFESWLKGLGRPPTQEELDRIAAPMLEALELLHAENFLHRDIAPDNIIVRPDGTPVLLDFGTARRAVAERSRVLTGIVKAGYSPQEQYASDSRLQGPWSDIYAFGGTLYRAVVGRPPEEATLRMMEDRMPAATRAAEGSYRPGFLAAIDRCLEATIQGRPQSIAQLRPMLLGTAPSKPRVERPATERPATQHPVAPRPATQRPEPVAPQRAVSPAIGAIQRLQLPARWPMIAAIVAVMGGAVGGILYARWAGDVGGRFEVETRPQDNTAAEERARRDAEGKREAEEAGKREEAKAQQVGQAERDYQEAQRYLSGRDVAVDYVKAREGFERAAAAGHTGGMVGLGWLHQSGRGVPRDFVTAREWYEKAAASGNSAGMAYLGWLHRDGLGVTKDYGRAREWYERSADAGNSGAMLSIAGLHQNGWGVPKDFGRAREWYEKAAAKGNPTGMLNLGVFYRDGVGVPRDYAKAKDWFEKAVAKGQTGAMVTLGQLYQYGRGVPQDYVKAREWYEKAAAAGNAIAMSNLGWLWRDGLGGPRDLGKTREWFEKSAAAGSGLGMNGLGVLYLNGEGVPKDFAKAREWYEKAAAAGEDNAMTNLGRLYQNGSGVPQDYVKAREWYGKAAAAGNRLGMGNLAALLDQGRGGPVDHARAAGLLLDAAKGNNGFIVQSLRGDMKSWTARTRTELKRELARLGHYSGAIDDNWDATARKAVDAMLGPGR